MASNIIVEQTYTVVIIKVMLKENPFNCCYLSALINDVSPSLIKECSQNFSNLEFSNSEHDFENRMILIPMSYEIYIVKSNIFQNLKYTYSKIFWGNSRNFEILLASKLKPVIENELCIFNITKQFIKPVLLPWQKDIITFVKNL